MFDLRRYMRMVKRADSGGKDIASISLKDDNKFKKSDVEINNGVISKKTTNSYQKQEETDSYQKRLIIADDIAVDPILDFNLYRDAIANIVRYS